MARKKRQNSLKTIITIILIIAAAVWTVRPLLSASNEVETESKQEEVAGNSSDLQLSTIVDCDMNGCLVLQHTGYVTCFDLNTNNPKWVAWELTDGETEGEEKRSDYNFMPDELLPASHQVVTQDYVHSGYDRGHMCPAADMKWSQEAMHDCFYMSNICPQMPDVNQKYWERLENACRRWAKREGSIYVVCGPVYSSEHPKILNGRACNISIPDAFFKVVLTLNEGHEKGIAFYYTNKEDRQTMESALRTIDDIEVLTGYDFFSALPDDLEKRLEAQKDLRIWN